MIYGKSDFKSIAKHVATRTSVQVYECLCACGGMRACTSIQEHTYRCCVENALTRTAVYMLTHGRSSRTRKSIGKQEVHRGRRHDNIVSHRSIIAQEHQKQKYRIQFQR